MESAPIVLYRQKDPHPSATMLAPDGHRYRCPWLEDSITIHSDGNTSCGLDDPHAKRSYGNVHEQRLADLYQNPEIDRMRQNLWEGYRCKECSLYQQIEDASPPPQSRQALPATIVVETTVKCNLRCSNAACDPNNEPGLLTRHKSHLDLEQFQDIIDQLRESLATVYFFNYGEPFLHTQAEDMLLYLRAACPDVEVFTSTNGIPLARAPRARKVVDSRIDRMTFTISGVRQESYVRYHANGQVGSALQGLQNICEMKRDMPDARPIVTWRYLVFRWNDTEKEIDSAIALAELYGVDQFCLYLTHIPPNASSYRLAPGTRLNEKYAKFIDFVHGYECAIVDERGFYPVEEIGGLGLGRWSCWRAVALCRPRYGCVNVTVSTNRPSSLNAQQYCIIRTAWIAVRVPLKTMHWISISLPIPAGSLGCATFDVEIINQDYWFPIDECGSADTRCLGVIVREESTEADDSQCVRGEPLSPSDLEQLAGYGGVLTSRRLPHRGGRMPV